LLHHQSLTVTYVVCTLDSYNRVL